MFKYEWLYDIMRLYDYTIICYEWLTIQSSTNACVCYFQLRDSSQAVHWSFIDHVHWRHFTSLIVHWLRQHFAAWMLEDTVYGWGSRTKLSTNCFDWWTILSPSMIGDVYESTNVDGATLRVLKDWSGFLLRVWWRKCYRKRKIVWGYSSDTLTSRLAKNMFTIRSQDWTNLWILFTIEWFKRDWRCYVELDRAFNKIRNVSLEICILISTKSQKMFNQNTRSRGVAHCFSLRSMRGWFLAGSAWAITERG